VLKLYQAHFIDTGTGLVQDMGGAFLVFFCVCLAMNVAALPMLAALLNQLAIVG
jgi:hypothetical protein